MSEYPYFHRLPGPFNFLRPDQDDVQTLFPNIVKHLPQPHSVYLQNENTSPLPCLPVVVSEELRRLSTALERYLRTEEAVQIRILKRQSFDSRKYNAVWDHYRRYLLRISENVVTSSYGRDFPQIFWLYHSLDVSRVLKDTAKRILRHDLPLGRERGDEIRYSVLFKYLDRVFSLLYDLASHLSHETDEFEEELFPPLLTQMRDNVLIFTEDHVSRDLDELPSYFRGYLKIDGRDLRARLARLRKWNERVYKESRDLGYLVHHVMGLPEDSTADEALLRPGYLSYASRRREYNASRLLSDREVEVWERLLLKLKEFELVHAHRRMVVRIDRLDRGLVCDPRDAARVGAGKEALVLAPSSRPMDFSAPWVVDPQVSRGGLIYDITDFSATISRIRLSDRKMQEDSFVSIFRFQRRFDQIANDLRLKWEKYLGDGAFYSGRDPRRLLVAAIEMQRHYSQALDEGFPFNAGMRIALNFGEYRLLPFGSTKTVTEEARYEVFGHGVVELSRLVSGKTTRELEDVKNTLVTNGYSERAVNEFFAPLLSDRVELGNRQEEQRRFYAYLNPSGGLINEGIVATARFITELDRGCRFEAFFQIREGDRDYVAVDLGRDGGELLVGLRKLGMASLKGLDRLPVYEVLDGQNWTLTGATPLPASDLTAAVDENYTSLIARS